MEIVDTEKDLNKLDQKQKIDINDALLRNKPNFICYGIHKKFIPKIIEALNSDKINVAKKTMFPDFKKLKEDITFENITKNIKVDIRKVEQTFCL